MREQGGWGGTEFMSLGLEVDFLPISKFVFFSEFINHMGFKGMI